MHWLVWEKELRKQIEEIPGNPTQRTPPSECLLCVSFINCQVIGAIASTNFFHHCSNYHSSFLLLVSNYIPLWSTIVAPVAPPTISHFHNFSWTLNCFLSNVMEFFVRRGNCLLVDCRSIPIPLLTRESNSHAKICILRVDGFSNLLIYLNMLIQESPRRVICIIY